MPYHVGVATPYAPLGQPERYPWKWVGGELRTYLEANMQPNRARQERVDALINTTSIIGREFLLLEGELLQTVP